MISYFIKIILEAEKPWQKGIYLHLPKLERSDGWRYEN